jgi:hypothetical protein
VASREGAAPISSNTLAADAAGAKPQLISAAAFKPSNAASGEKLTVVPGLGLEGQGITRLAFDGPAFTPEQIQQAPYVEYRTKLPAGTHQLAVRTLPTFHLYDGRGLRYAISVDGSAPQVVDLHTPADSKDWKVNVLRGYTEGRTQYAQTKSGKATIRIYLLDPGVVFNQLEIQ